MYRHLLVTMITGGNALAWIAFGMSQGDPRSGWATSPPATFWLYFPLALASAWAALALTKETTRLRASYRIELLGRRRRVLLARETKDAIRPDRGAS